MPTSIPDITNLTQYIHQGVDPSNPPAGRSNFYIDITNALRMLDETGGTDCNIASPSGINLQGLTNIAPVASTSGSPSLLKVTGPSHTTLNAATEASDVLFDLSRPVEFTGAASGFTVNLQDQRAIRVNAPTYTFSGTTNQEIFRASTFSIAGPPVQGTRAIIQDRYSLWVESGNSRLEGQLILKSNNTSDYPITFVDDTTTGIAYRGVLPEIQTIEFVGVPADGEDITLDGQPFVFRNGAAPGEIETGSGNLTTIARLFANEVNDFGTNFFPVTQQGTLVTLVTDNGPGATLVITDNTAGDVVITKTQTETNFPAQINFNVNGNIAVNMQDGQTFFQAGSTSSTPGIAFQGAGGGGSTGIWLPSANTLGVTAGGVQQVSFTATDTDFTSKVKINSQAVGDIPLTINGLIGQTANLFETKLNNGILNFAINKSGGIVTNNIDDGGFIIRDISGNQIVLIHRFVNAWTDNLTATALMGPSTFGGNFFISPSSGTFSRMGFAVDTCQFVDEAPTVAPVPENPATGQPVVQVRTRNTTGGQGHARQTLLLKAGNHTTQNAAAVYRDATFDFSEIFEYAGDPANDPIALEILGRTYASDTPGATLGTVPTVKIIAPTAGTNMTITEPLALHLIGDLKMESNIDVSDNIVMGGQLTAGSGSVVITDATGNIQASALPTIPTSKGGTGNTTAPTTGQLMIGNAGVWNLSTLTAGTNITIDYTTVPGQIIISSTGGTSFPLSAPDGSASAPSYSFTNNSNMGMFRSGTNVLGIASGGNTVLTVRGSGLDVVGDGGGGLVAIDINQGGATAPIARFRVAGLSKSELLGGSNPRWLMPTGTVTEPGIGFITDTDTGIYSDATNVLSFTAGGGNSLRVRGAGIEIDGNSGGGFPALNINLVSGSSDVLRLRKAGTIIATLTGATTPQWLSPYGTEALPGVSFEGDANNGMWRSGFDQIGFSANGTNRLTINANGLALTNGSLRTVRSSITLGAGASSFSAAGTNIISLTGDAGTNTITSITGGLDGQELTIIFLDSNVTINDSGTLKLTGVFNSSADATLTLVYNGSNWYEKSRSIN